VCLVPHCSASVTMAWQIRVLRAVRSDRPPGRSSAQKCIPSWCCIVSHGGKQCVPVGMTALAWTAWRPRAPTGRLHQIWIYLPERPALPARRLMFEPFGGVRTAMEAAATGLPPDALLDMQDWEGALNCADPEYEKPCVRDLEAILIAFDVLYCDEQARRGCLAWRARGERGHAPRASQLAGVAQPQVLCMGLSAVLNRQGRLLKCL